MMLYHASPHKWGPDKNHFLDPNGEDDLDQVKTLCGRVVRSIRGKPDFGSDRGRLPELSEGHAAAGSGSPGGQVRRMRLLHIDIETRPRRKLSLKTVGVDGYAPECEI